MIVVDASVIGKWINPQEQDSSIAISLQESHLKGDEEIVVPQLLFLEIANLLATKTMFEEKRIKESLQFIFDCKLNVYAPEKTDIIESCLLAKKYKTSVYDMFYAVIAKRKKIRLITADERLKVKTKFSFVMLLKNYESEKEPE